MVKVKMCGFTRTEDIDAACELGVDAVGMVFYPPSPRHVTIEQAKLLVGRITPFTKSVALFVDEEPQTVADVLEQVPVDLIQFHGSETADYCKRFNRPYIKVLKLSPGVIDSNQAAEVLAQQIQSHSIASGFLIDSDVSGHAGGSGQSFSWSVLAKALEESELENALDGRALVIAGGLDASNCGTCIDLLSPYALDVSSGIESAKGVKDPARMRAFMQAAHQQAS